MSLIKFLKNISYLSGFTQEKLAASLISPLPLYLGLLGIGAYRPGPIDFSTASHHPSAFCVRINDFVRSLACLDPFLDGFIKFESLGVRECGAPARSGYGEHSGKILSFFRTAQGFLHCFVIFNILPGRKSRAAPGGEHDDFAARFLERLQVWIVRINSGSGFLYAQARIPIHIESLEIPVGILKNNSFEIIEIDREGFLFNHHGPVQLTPPFKAGVYGRAVFKLRTCINLLNGVYLAGGETVRTVPVLALYGSRIEFAARGELQ